jgi:hypothetical protein
VHTEHDAVAIEKIKVGDRVWARNERTGATELRTVTHIAPQHFDKLMELRVAGEKSALHPTPTHPFWARRNASDPAHWIDAGDVVGGWPRSLAIGDRGKTKARVVKILLPKCPPTVRQSAVGAIPNRSQLANARIQRAS